MAADFAFSADLRTRITGNLARFQPRLLGADGLRHAAVGLVLLPDAGDRTCFVLTRRQSTLRRHAGQWALPGGRREPGETSEAAALREIHEEISLDLRPEAVLGRLDDFVTRSGHLISPFVLWVSGQAALVASPDEVEAAFRVPLSELDHPEALRLRPDFVAAYEKIAQGYFRLNRLPEAITAYKQVTQFKPGDATAYDNLGVAHLKLMQYAEAVEAPTAAILYQFREVALHGREVRVADVEQPFFTWH